MGDTALDQALADVAEQAERRLAMRERSSIGFPYLTLVEATEVADTIHENVGNGSCAGDQLAPWLSLSPKSSGFRLRVSAAKLFGLIESPSSGSYTLTELGRKIVDQKQRRSAKSEAFLKVPLFSAAFDRFRGNVLPPAAALEREFHELGVAKKQTGKARSSFERSAEAAGYFSNGRDRLVKPGFAEAKSEPEQTAPNQELASEPSRSRNRHPLIEGLLATLPPEDGPWAVEERVVWLKTAATGFDLIYGIEGTITIEGSASGTK